MSGDSHILPGAFGDEPKTVPLVIYEADGTRRVIGEATLTPQQSNLAVQGHIFDPEVAKQVGYAVEWMDGFSLMTAPSPKHPPPPRSKFEKEHPDGR